MLIIYLFKHYSILNEYAPIYAILGSNKLSFSKQIDDILHAHLI